MFRLFGSLPFAPVVAAVVLPCILLVAGPAAAATVYETGFEAGEGPTYFDAGNINGQDNWADGPAEAQPVVQTGTVGSGAQALEIDGTAFSTEGELAIAASRNNLTDPTPANPLVTITLDLRITSDVEAMYGIATYDGSTRTSSVVFKPDFGPGDEDDILVNGVSAGVDWTADVNSWVALEITLDFTNNLADVSYKGGAIADNVSFLNSGGLTMFAIMSNDGWWASGSSMFVDNLSITAVPEPGAVTLLLVGAGAALASASRRRRNRRPSAAV